MPDLGPLHALVPFLFLGAFITVPIALVVVFVLVRAGRRRARLRGPWGALAQRIGGELREGSGFTGWSVVAPRPTHAVHVRMTLVSAAEAMSQPYYPDGGTFTEIAAELPWGQPVAFVPPGSKTQTFVDPTRVPALVQLGPSAEIFVDPKIARIVVPGVVEDVGLLEASTRALEELTRLVLSTGPLPVKAPA